MSPIYPGVIDLCVNSQNVIFIPWTQEFKAFEQFFFFWSRWKDIAWLDHMLLFFYLNLGHVWVYRYRFLADTCVPWVHFVCKATQPGGYTVSFYCYIKKNKNENAEMQNAEKYWGFLSPLYYERKTLGSICANSLIYTCNKREKFKVVIRNKHRYAMNGNVDISLNQ